MNCTRCNKKSETDFRHLGNLCRKCFFWIIEKRVKKVLKESKIKKNDKILLLDSLSEYFFKRIMKMPLTVIKKSKNFFNIKEFDESIFGNKKLKEFIKTNKIKKTIIPRNLDNEIVPLLKKHFKNSKIKENKKFVKLFKNILEDELILFSKLKRIPYKKMKKNDEKDFLDKIEKRYPGTKFSFLKSMNKLEEINPE